MNILGFCSKADLPCFSFTILPMMSVNYDKVVKKGLGRVLYFSCRNQNNVIQWSLEPTLVWSCFFSCISLRSLLRLFGMGDYFPFDRMEAAQVQVGLGHWRRIYGDCRGSENCCSSG